VIWLFRSFLLRCELMPRSRTAVLTGLIIGISVTSATPTQERNSPVLVKAFLFDVERRGFHPIEVQHNTSGSSADLFVSLRMELSTAFLGAAELTEALRLPPDRTVGQSSRSSSGS
jgi:hypothetical protein